MFESSVIVVYKSLSSPRCEKMDLKIIFIVGKGSNTHNTQFSTQKNPCQIKLVVLSRKHTFQQPSMSETQLQSGLR